MLTKEAITDKKLKPIFAEVCRAVIPPGGTPSSGLDREVPPERGAFFKLAVKVRVLTPK